jgi:hypothetical protein
MNKTYRVSTPNGYFYYETFMGAYNFAQSEAQTFHEVIYIDIVDVVRSVGVNPLGEVEPALKGELPCRLTPTS